MKRRRKSTSRPVRCAIYTRKSTTDHLDAEVTTLTVQRQKAEAYAASQDHWVVLPAKYDDGGFTGANTERPALRQLLADIDAGQIDTVIVYKIDRLSRSIIDFLHLLERFEAHAVGFVSTTESFNTKHSTGRLMMHILLSFAQYERELISERTSANMGAARRKGKFTGGLAILGYDVVDKKLVVNEEEAERVKAIFSLYLEMRTVRKVVAEVNRRGWQTKRHVTARRIMGGKKWNVGTLHRLLSNVTYTGQIKYGDETYDGDHEPIIDPALWKDVQAILAGNYNSGSAVRNKHKAMLRDLLFCGRCGEALVPHYTSKQKRRVRYYVCWSNRNNGADSCPTPSVPAVDMELYVMDLVKERADSPDVIAATAHRAEEEAAERVKALRAERTQLRRERGRVRSTVDRLVELGETEGLAAAKEEAKTLDHRLEEIGAEIEALQSGVDADHVGAAIAEWRPLWENLSADERARLVAAMIERAEYDGKRLRVTWREMEAAAEVAVS